MIGNVLEEEEEKIINFVSLKDNSLSSGVITIVLVCVHHHEFVVPLYNVPQQLMRETQSNG
jgi:hypothetical protein